MSNQNQNQNLSTNQSEASSNTFRLYQTSKTAVSLVSPRPTYQPLNLRQAASKSPLNKDPSKIHSYCSNTQTVDFLSQRRHNFNRELSQSKRNKTPIRDFKDKASREPSIRDSNDVLGLRHSTQN